MFFILQIHSSACNYVARDAIINKNCHLCMLIAVVLFRMESKVGNYKTKIYR